MIFFFHFRAVFVFVHYRGDEITDVVLVQQNRSVAARTTPHYSLFVSITYLCGKDVAMKVLILCEPKASI